MLALFINTPKMWRPKGLKKIIGKLSIVVDEIILTTAVFLK